MTSTVRLAGAAAVSALGLWLSVATAARADYVVNACSSDGAGTNHLFQPASTIGGSTRNLCLAGAGLQTKVVAGTQLNQGGWLQFSVPAGSSVVSYNASARRAWDGFGFAWTLDGGTTSGLHDGATLTGSPHTDFTWTQLGRQVGWSGLRLGTYCSSFACSGSYALVDWKNISVVIRDNAGGPVLSGESGLWNESGWVRGVRQASYSASDTVGVKIQRIEVDPGGSHGFAWPIDDNKACDFSYVVPCPASSTTSGGVDTTEVSDGSHVLRHSSMDSSGNWTAEDRTIQVDNHAPSAPLAASADGQGRASSPSFTLRWTNPDAQAAPLTRLHYTTCPAGSSAGCQDGTAAIANGGSGEQNAVTGSFGVSRPGAYDVSLWLEDAAGNSDRSSAAPLALTLADDTLPAAPALAAPPSGWVRDATYSERISYPAGAPEPASGIAGYAVTTDGSTPGATMNAPGRDATYAFVPLEGTSTIKARTVTGSGAVSATASVTLRVDRTPPATSVLGAGAAGVPSSGPVDLTLLGTDQPGLSGMGGADPGDAVESGAHVDYSLDGGPTVQVRGDEATLRISALGRHTISFRAYDAAGNASPARTFDVEVGEPPPPGARDHRGFWDASISDAAFTAAPSFASSCPPRTTLTANADAWIDQAAPSANHGAEDPLHVRSGAGRNARALLMFDLPALGRCAVTSAELRLAGSSTRPLVAYRLGSAWDSTSVTWENRPGPTGATAVEDGGDLTFDVTAQVAGLYRSGNAGLVVEDAAEGAAAAEEAILGSSESTEPSRRPQLIVTFG